MMMNGFVVFKKLFIGTEASIENSIKFYPTILAAKNSIAEQLKEDGLLIEDDFKIESASLTLSK